jgi:hypothetical protein
VIKPASRRAGEILGRRKKADRLVGRVRKGDGDGVGDSIASKKP